VLVAALTYSLTSEQTVLYSVPAVQTANQVAPLAVLTTRQTYFLHHLPCLTRIVGLNSAKKTNKKQTKTNLINFHLKTKKKKNKKKTRKPKL
jgi:hypothetical protein